MYMMIQNEVISYS